jgi:hypothetical protein
MIEEGWGVRAEGGESVDHVWYIMYYTLLIRKVTLTFTYHSNSKYLFSDYSAYPDVNMNINSVMRRHGFLQALMEHLLKMYLTYLGKRIKLSNNLNFILEFAEFLKFVNS